MHHMDQMATILITNALQSKNVSFMGVVNCEMGMKQQMSVITGPHVSHVAIQ